MLSARGPVVIDWTNAAAGDPMTDIALTWVLVASGGIPRSRLVASLMGIGRSMLIGGFLQDVDRAVMREHAVDVPESPGFLDG